MINLSTKFEVSTFTQYEAMKDNEKCRNWGGLGRSESPKVIGNIGPNHSIERIYDFLFDETMRLPCTIFALYRVICQKLSILT